VVLGLACVGAADRHLGMLATTLSRFDDAARHFVQARALEERIGGRALLPRTAYWEARLARARGDDNHARALLSGVLDDTERLGMRNLHAQAADLLRR